MKPALVTVAFIVIATLMWGFMTMNFLTRSGYDTTVVVKIAIFAVIALGTSIVAFPLRKLL